MALSAMNRRGSRSRRNSKPTELSTRWLSCDTRTLSWRHVQAWGPLGKISLTTTNGGKLTGADNERALPYVINGWLPACYATGRLIK